MATLPKKLIEIVRERALAPDLVVLLLAGVGCGYVLWAMRGYGLDDSYITYVVAQNLADGQGLVFNPGERIQVSTTPLYTLFLTLFALMRIDLPSASLASSAVFLFTDVALLLALGRCLGSAWAGRVAALTFMFHPLVIRTLGHETPLFMALVLGASLAYLRRAYRWVTVCSALALLCRGDGILIAGLLFLFFLVEHRRVPWREVALFAGIAAPWFLFAWIYFGTPLPSTLGAKIEQYRVFRGYPTFLAELHRHGLPASPLTFLRLGLMGIGLYAVIDRRAALLPLWAGLYVLGYVALGVSGVFFWYYVPLIPVALLLLGMGMVALWGRLVALAPGRWSWGMHGVLLLAALVAGYHQQRAYRESYDRYLKPIVGRRAATSKLGNYLLVGSTWMRRCMRPRERLATTEIGALGFSGRRPILDLLGLANPQVFPWSAQSPDDNAAVVARFRPEYYGDFTWRRWMHQIRNTRPDPRLRSQGGPAWLRHQRSLAFRRKVVEEYVLHRSFTFVDSKGSAVFQIWRRKDVVPLPSCGR